MTIAKRISSTRVSESSKIAIGFLFSNHDPRTVQSVAIACAISDHSINYCTVKSGVRRAPPKFIEHRSYRAYDKNGFMKDLKKLNWHLVNNEDVIDLDVKFGIILMPQTVRQQQNELSYLYLYNSNPVDDLRYKPSIVIVERLNPNHVMVRVCIE